MKKNIILIGMRASGKSHIGSILAKKLQMPFWDLDKEIEKKIGMSITHLVKRKGWEAFRSVESRACQLIGQKSGCVIATGGGVVTSNANVEYLKKNGFIIWLKAPISDLAQRLEGAQMNKTQRPSLTGKPIIEELEEVYKEREQLYEAAADLIFDCPNHTGQKIKDVKRHARELHELLENFDWQQDHAA